MKKSLTLIIFICLRIFCWAVPSAALRTSPSTSLRTGPDSALISYASAELKKLQQDNEEALRSGEREKLNFILTLSPDTSGNYMHQNTLPGKEPWLTQAPEIASLNSKLRKVFFDDSVECYLILINYFDVMMKAEIPAGLTVSDLFNTGKFFDSNSNITELKARHDTITNSIIANAIKGTNRSCIVLSYANYSGKIYGRSAKKYAFFTQKLVEGAPHSSSALLPTVNDVLKKKMHDCVDPRYRCGNNVGIAQTVVDQVVGAVTVAKAKQLIMNTYSSVGLFTIFRLFNSNNDFYGLSTEERLHSLSVFVTDIMYGGYNGNPGPEGFAVKIIRYTPQKEVVGLLKGLEKSSALNTDPNYWGDKSNSDALIYRLVGKIDDNIIGGIGGDNYKLLNQSLADLTLSSQEVRDSFSTATPGNVADRMIYWDDSHVFTVPPIGHSSYEVEFDADGTIKYRRRVVDHYVIANENVIPQYDETYPQVTLRPFDLVAFVNRSNCNMIAQAGASKGGLNFMPAIFLKYANDKVFNETTMEIIATTVDVVTLATGPGLIYEAARAGRIGIALFEAANTIGAGANLTMNSLGVQDPKLRTVLDEFNAIVGIWGLTRLSVNGVFRLGNALDAVMDETKIIMRVSEDEARTFVTAYEDAKNELGSLSPTDKERLDKMKDLLKKSVGQVNGGVFEIVRGTSYNDFINSVAEFKNGANAELAHQAYNLWRDEKWSELEQLFNSNNFNLYREFIYPPNGGFIEIEACELEIGTEIDRYGGEIVNGAFKDNGKYVSPKGASFESRALPSSDQLKPYKKYRVIKSIPLVTRGKAIPWFSQSGLGIQYRLPYGINELKRNGYIVEITE